MSLNATTSHWGCRGRGFKSRRSDQFFPKNMNEYKDIAQQSWGVALASHASNQVQI